MKIPNNSIIPTTYHVKSIRVEPQIPPILKKSSVEGEIIHEENSVETMGSEHTINFPSRDNIIIDELPE